MTVPRKGQSPIGAVLNRCFKFFSLKEACLEEIRDRWGREIKTYRPRSDIELLHSLTKDSNTNNSVDDSTWNDLDMDTLFDRIDGTTTPIGRHHLYRQLRTYEPDNSKLQSQYQAAQHFKANSKFREQVQLNMWRLRSSNASAITRMLFGELPKGDFPHLLAWCLALISVASIAMAFIWPILLWLPLIPMAANFIFAEAYSHKIGRHSLSFVYLRNLLTVARRLSALDSNNLSQLEYLKSKRKNIRRLRAQFRIVGLDSTSGDLITAQCAFFLNVLCLFDFLVFMRCAKQLNESKEDLRKIYFAVASIDSAIAVASYLTYASHHCNPTFTDTTEMNFEGLTHPLLKNSVPNDYTSDENSALITGSNMAGKSTFIKAIGTNLILAQTVWLCHSASAVVPKASVMSSIKHSDSLSDGKSYYFTEIEALQRLIIASEGAHPCVFLIDEILHGTNTIERIACAAAVLDKISNANTVLVTSHDIELSRLLPSRYHSYHFRETANLDNMFDYKLREGHSTTRNAISLLEAIGFPADVIKAARKTASELDA